MIIINRAMQLPIIDSLWHSGDVWRHRSESKSVLEQCSVKWKKHNTMTFIQGNASENAVCKMSAILDPIALTHRGRETHICVGKLAIIGSDNGLSPGRRQAIIWTIAGILLIGPLGTNFSEILIGIQTFSFKKMHLKTSSAKWRPFVSASMC